MLRSLMTFSVLALISFTSWGQEAGTPKHLVEARKLLKQVDLNNTSYKHGAPEITWQGTCASHTDCSGFIDGLLAHTYGYDDDAFKKWFGSRRPTAARYHDAIVEGKGFSQVKNVSKVLPGDFIAVKYLHRKDNTGHVMLVAEAPSALQRRSLSSMARSSGKSP
ncbi:MAG: NlpC/P60 family protein [Gemmatales bacterium]